MIKNRLKSGFTLVELMVFFVFITLLLAASTPLVTKRVKSMPVKVFHGRYVCYRNAGGQLVEAYYNSVRQISLETVGACTFEPPKKSNLFKIEMIGGGAGGYTYHNEREEENDYGSGEYEVGSGFTGINTSIKPDGAQLRRIFNGAKFSRSKSTSAGGFGSYVSVKYTPLSTLKGFVYGVEYAPKEGYEYLNDCDKESAKASFTPEQIGHCTSYKTKKENANKKIVEMYNTVKALPEVESSNYDLITSSQNLAAVNAELEPYAIYKSASQPKTVTAYGGRGGGNWNSPRYINYIGTIDFKDFSTRETIPTSNVEQYLQKFTKNFQWGSVSEPASGGKCIGWSSTSPSSGADAEDYKEIQTTTYGDKGGDVLNYNALQIGNFCVSNVTKATGGDGAIMEIINTYPTHIRYYGTSSERFSIKDGEPASGIAGNEVVISKLGSGHSVSLDENSIGNKYPSMIIDTTLHKVKHVVGLNGKAGEVKSFFATGLEDCTFRIGAAGQPITADTTQDTINEMQERLKTSISCNGDTIKHTVDGGTYRKETYTKSHSEFDNLSKYLRTDFYKNQGGTPPVYTAVTFDPDEERESVSKYVPATIFSRYNAIAGLGAGGKGSKIEDKCMIPKGYYKHTLKTMDGTVDNSKTESYDLPYVQCDLETDYIKTDATAGSGGAVIITW